jgi:ribosomal protein L37AE/L43A
MNAPRFLTSVGQSKCHRSKELLVRSRAGGLISRNCLKCGRPDRLRRENLPILDCEKCGTRLNIKQDRYESYIYHCGQCDCSWKLGDNLPDWSVIFPYFGFSANSDRRAT